MAGAAVAHSGHGAERARSFGASLFRSHYMKSAAPEFQDELMRAAREFIFACAAPPPLPTLQTAVCV